jgi:hypothetical protein
MRHALLATTFAIVALALLMTTVGCNRSGPTTGTAPAPAPPLSQEKADELVAEFRTQLWAVLAKQNPQAELAEVVNKYAVQLRPPNGSKTYTSKDKAFVLVIAANGSNGEPGGDAQAEDTEARLVVAVAGDGGPAGGRNRGGNGGKASARAAGGVAVAVGGRGGDGGGGGGDGASTKVEGKVGGIGLAGPGGSGIGPGASGGAGGAGSSGGGNPLAIIEAAKEELGKK